MRPSDDVRAADCRSWLEFARKDLEIGNMLLKKGDGYRSFAMFHFQQAVEKSLKGFLAFHGHPFKKIHDLGKLGKLCISVDRTLDSHLQAIDSLSKYAVSTRYPGEFMEEITSKQAKEAVRMARLVIKEVSSRVLRAKHPA